MSFWDFFWLLIWSYIFVAYLVLLFHIITDVFRDRDLGGFAKALWMIGLIVFPFLIAFIYLIARGKGMTERAIAQAQAQESAQKDYIRDVAGNDAASQIAKGQELLSSGAITQQEFDAIKAKALA
jgi:predicted ferric reductase